MELDISIDSAKEEKDYKKWKTFFDCLDDIIRPKKRDVISGNSSNRLLPGYSLIGLVRIGSTD